ncbi:beta-galactosidase [Bacteroidales bacterium]|nr:beta-galactosidase [Bacteroidales bacterium]
MKQFITTGILLLFLSACNSPKTDKIDLAGEWTVVLDSTDVGIQEQWTNTAFDQNIQLPGTTDDAELGVANTLEARLEKPQLTYLTRKYAYLGAAWYSREINVPSNWKDKEYILKLERVIWKTQVWIDGQEIPMGNNSLIAPHYFDLSTYLLAGKTQRITILVDNRKQLDMSVDNLAHSYTNHTQIIWNGIIGEISVEALPAVRIANIQTIPNIASQTVLVKLHLINHTDKAVEADLSLMASLKGDSKMLEAKHQVIGIEKGSSTATIEYAMGEDCKWWSEFQPAVYQLEAKLATKGQMESRRSVDFGMRKFSREGSVLTINDKPLFLRGTLECNIFPLTGHPPMDKEGWEKVFVTAKAWGLNHLRFHSWCPPKAAFEVADEMGFYLQIELPAWYLTVGADDKTTNFLYAEAQRIIEEYGNHPSFCMWSLGNELQGDMSVLSKLMNHLKNEDPRHLYTTTSFTFEKGHGNWPEAGDDFFITQWTNKGWVRGQGVFNSESPTFDKDYVKSIEGMTVPLITHEIGQYAVYPNLDEIDKYTGVLQALNFLAIESDLESKGMLDKAADYTMASGKLAAILYKEEIERALKTAGISGFQLLDLHDFPGQGTALVGLLDAFWDSKGIITDKEFSQFSAPVVPLLRFAKAAYVNQERFIASLDVSNFSDEDLSNKSIKWTFFNGDKIFASGNAKVNIKMGYNHQLHQMDVDLSQINQASKLRVEVELEDTPYKNQWNIWVYPQHNTAPVFGEVKYTRHLKEALELLAKGHKVLLNPDWKKIKGIEGKFVPVFWSPVHFPKQAGTMGLLCDPAHKALASFPTDMHTDWQWWDLNINSTTMIVDSIVGGKAIVEMIDNFTNNRKLASLYEGSIGKGKLIVASFDLSTKLDQRPVAKQMLLSLLEYMNSTAFAPTEIRNPESLSKHVLQQHENKAKESVRSIY